MPPLLDTSALPNPSGLFKKDTSHSHMGPPDTSDRMETGENGDSSKENVDPLMQDLQVMMVRSHVYCHDMFCIPGPGV